MGNTVNNLFPNRISFNFDGEEFASFGADRKRPKNQSELVELLEDILDLIKAKSVQDTELI